MKITMSSIITGLSYKVRIEGTSDWETKSQSGSTSTLMNLQLVKMLLIRIRASGCQTRFPLLLDEAAAVNLNQFNWLIPEVESFGFSLFGAGTYSSSTELMGAFKRIFRLDSMHTSIPYNAERTKVFWGEPEGKFENNAPSIHSLINAEQQTIEFQTI